MLAATVALAESDFARTRMADATRPVPAGPSNGRVFLRRLISTVLLWPIVISSLFSGLPILSDDVFLFMLMALAQLGLAAYQGMEETRDLVCSMVLCCGRRGGPTGGRSRRPAR